MTDSSPPFVEHEETIFTGKLFLTMKYFRHKEGIGSNVVNVQEYIILIKKSDLVAYLYIFLA